MTVVPETEELAQKMATADISMMSDKELDAAPKVQEDNEAGFGALASERGMFPLRSIKVSSIMKWSFASKAVSRLRYSAFPSRARFKVKSLERHYTE